MTPDDGDPPLSEAAEDLDDRARGLVSDLTPFDVRERKPKRSNDLTNWLIAIAALLLLVALVVAILYASGTLETGVAVSGASVDAGGTNTNPETGLVDSDVDGPLSGTWFMHSTNSEGDERPVFTVVFTGTDRGTVEILEDDTEFDTHFRLDGDTVWFTFTRVFDFETDDSQTVKWPEISVFTGAFTGVDKISGEWARDDWECLPDRDPPCVYKADAVGDPSYLLRE